MLTQSYIHSNVDFVGDGLKKKNLKTYENNVPGSSSESMICNEILPSKDLEAIRLSEHFTECINNDNYYDVSDLTSDNDSSIMDIFEPRDLASLGLELTYIEGAISNHAVFKHKDTHKPITAFDNLSNDDILFKPELNYKSDECEEISQADSTDKYNIAYESKIMNHDLLNNEDLKEIALVSNKNEKRFKLNKSINKDDLLYINNKGSINTPATTVAGYKKIIKGTFEKGLGKILKKDHLIESGTQVKIESKVVLQSANVK